MNQKAWIKTYADFRTSIRYCWNTSNVTTYVESAAGISGRAGLTALVRGYLLRCQAASQHVIA